MPRLGDIAQRFGLALRGNPDLEIEGLCGISDNLPGRLSFLARPKHARAAQQSLIPAFVVPPGVEVAGKSCLEHAAPEVAIARVASLFERSRLSQDCAIHPSAVIDPSARLGEGVRIGPFVVIGRDAAIIEAAISACGLPMQYCADMEEAVRWLAGQAQTGDCVLLSPACASLDQFKSFEARGDRFTELVMGL